MTEQNKPRRARLSEWALDAGVVVGMLVFISGLYQVWHPLAPVVGGLALTACCGFAGYDRLRRRGER